jgi:CBS domain containing-hemolysin-like protein
VISLGSEELMAHSNTVVAFLILLAIVLLGIVFDVVGVAVTSADEKPFHSMAARKVPGARDAIRLRRQAEKVSSICNDVIGDICGIISGSTGITIAIIIAKVTNINSLIITLLTTAIIASLTIGGKAIGKSFAINKSNSILYKFVLFLSIFYRK